MIYIYLKFYSTALSQFFLSPVNYNNSESIGGASSGAARISPSNIDPAAAVVLLFVVSIAPPFVATVVEVVVVGGCNKVIGGVV